MGPSTLVPSASTPSESIGRPISSTSRHWPIELKCSSANPGGSMTAWQPAHGCFARCISVCSRTVLAFTAPALLLSSSVGTFGGGGIGGVSRNVLRTYLPRYTGDVRVATAVSDRSEEHTSELQSHH